MPHLPEGFHKIRLELAREPGHPAGDRRVGYEFVAPLDADGRIDAEKWRESPDSCGVWAFHANTEGRVGTLDRDERGEWYFDYDPATNTDNEFGYHLGRERFRIGEYVSIADNRDKMHTYRVVSVEQS